MADWEGGSPFGWSPKEIPTPNYLCEKSWLVFKCRCAQIKSNLQKFDASYRFFILQRQLYWRSKKYLLISKRLWGQCPLSKVETFHGMESCQMHRKLPTRVCICSPSKVAMQQNITAAKWNRVKCKLPKSCQSPRLWAMKGLCISTPTHAYTGTFKTLWQGFHIPQFFEVK